MLSVLPFMMFILFLMLKHKKFEHFIPALTFFRMLVISEVARNAFIGIVEVYGTTSSKSNILAVTSAVALAGTVVSLIVCAATYKRSRNNIRLKEDPDEVLKDASDDIVEESPEKAAGENPDETKEES